MKKRAILLCCILTFLLTGCLWTEWTDTELCIITPSGRNIKCDLMEEEDLLIIEGTEEYQFTFVEEERLLYIENKEGERIFTQKRVKARNNKTYRGSMNADGTLWICMEKWDPGNFYMGSYRRGYLNGMPVETELWKIDPETGEVLFHEEEELFYITHTDEWVYFYDYGYKRYRNDEWITKEARILRRSIEDWDTLEVVKEMGYTEFPSHTYILNFEISDESIIVTGTAGQDTITVGPITIMIAEDILDEAETKSAKSTEFLYRNMSFLDVDYNPDSSIPEELEKALGEHLLTGTLMDFLGSNPSDYSILTESEIEESIAQDESGVLGTFQQTEGKSEDEWIRFKRDGDIIVRQRSDDAEYLYYKFPKQEDANGYEWGLYAYGIGEEYYFLNWENEDYFITVKQDDENRIQGIATYCMFTDGIYGWLMYQEIVNNDIQRQYTTYIQNGNDYVGSSKPSFLGGIGDAQHIAETISPAIYEHMTLEERHGGQVKEDEKYRYVCSTSRIYKVDKETNEAEVLWELAEDLDSPKLFDKGCALLVGDKLYFVEDMGNVSVINIDGTGYRTLITDISEKNKSLFLQKELLYIVMDNGEYCYKLLADGSLKEAGEGTYTKMPEGYSCAEYKDAGTQYLSAAESMERFGCIFAMDEDNEVVQIKNGISEKMDAKRILCISGECLLFRSDRDGRDIDWVWNSITGEKFDTDYPPMGRVPVTIGMDEEYVYFFYDITVEEDKEAFVVDRMTIESGELEEVFRFEDYRGMDARVCYTIGKMFQFSQEKGCFYYTNMKDGDMYVMGRSLEDAGTEEILSPAFFDTNISDVGKLVYYFDEIYSQPVPELLLMTIKTERLVVDEKYEGAEKINQFLQEQEQNLISDREKSAAFIDEWVKETGDIYVGGNSADSSVPLDVYLNEKYLSFYQHDYLYDGGAHGMPYRTGYTFDLQTGERLKLDDIVGNSEEEVKKIITKYAEEYIHSKSSSFHDDAVEDVEKNASFDSTFYLSEEGIVFFYEPYELAGYAAGFIEITIPYEAFKMKIEL